MKKVIVVLVAILAGCSSEPTEVAARHSPATTSSAHSPTSTATTTTTSTRPSTPTSTATPTTTSTTRQPRSQPTRQTDRQFAKGLLQLAGLDEHYVSAHLSYVTSGKQITCSSQSNMVFGSDSASTPVIWCLSAKRFYLLEDAMAKVRSQNLLVAAGYVLLAAADHQISNKTSHQGASNTAAIVDAAGVIAKRMRCQDAVNTEDVHGMMPAFNSLAQRFYDVATQPC